jgi:hypothetical protein
VMEYDGSYQQWGSYVSTAATNKVPDVWQTDAVTPGTTINRTFNISGVVPIAAGSSVVLDLSAYARFTSITDPLANQELIEDTAYFTGGTTSTGTTSGGGSSVNTGGGC